MKILERIKTMIERVIKKMPTLETVRRIIGKNLLQHYCTDDNTEGGDGGNMNIAEGTITGGIDDTIDIGFKPKFMFVAFNDVDNELTVYWVMDGFEVSQTDYMVTDFDETERRVVRQNWSDSETRRDFYFTNDGFRHTLPEGTAYYFAIG